MVMTMAQISAAVCFMGCRIIITIYVFRCLGAGRQSYCLELLHVLKPISGRLRFRLSTHSRARAPYLGRK